MITVWENYTQQNPETYAAIDLPVLADGITDVIYCPFCRDLFIQVDIAGMTSGESVTGRVEGSLDGVGWDNLAADQLDTVISENGSTLASYTGAVPPYIRAIRNLTVPDVNSKATIALKFHIAIMA